VSLYASIAVLDCPSCGLPIPYSAIEFRNQPSIAVHICKHCKAELQVEKPALGGRYIIDLLKKN
jgi:transcription elongation factor Elf1